MPLSRMNRAVASLLAVILVVSLVFAPALHVNAEDAFAGSAEVQFTMNSLDIGIKVNADTEHGMIAVNGGMGINGNTMAQAGVYLGKEGLVLELIPILRSAIGIDLANLTEKLPKSIFAPNSGSSFAMDQESYDLLMNGLDAALQQTLSGQAVQFSQEQADVLMPHVEVFLSTLMESAELLIEPTTSVPGQLDDTNAVRTRIVVNPEALANILGETLESLASDSKAIAVIGAFMDQLAAAQGMANLPKGKTGEEALNEALSDIAKVRQNLTENILRSNAGITVSLFTGVEEEELMAVTVELTDNKDHLFISVYFSNGRYGIWIFENGKTVTLEFRINENTDEAFECDFHAVNPKNEVITLTFNWNKVTGEFALAFYTLDGITRSMKGTIQTTEDTAVITLTSVDDTDVSDANFRLILRANDPIEVPEYQDVLSMSEEEFQTLFQNAYNTVRNLFGSVLR